MISNFFHRIANKLAVKRNYLGRSFLENVSPLMIHFAGIVFCRSAL